MKNLGLIISLVLAFTAFFGKDVLSQTRAPAPAAQTAPAAPSTSETEKPAQPLSITPLSPIATQLGQTLQTLVGGVPPATTDPTTTTAEPVEEPPVQIKDTFASGMMGELARAIDKLKDKDIPHPFSASFMSDLSSWIDAQKNDSRKAALWNTIGKDLLIIIAPPLLACLAFVLFIIPLRYKIKRAQPKTLMGRVGILFALMMLRLFPIFVFLGGALLLLEQNEAKILPRFVILNVIYAISIGYIVQQILRALFAPTTEHLRIFPLTTAQAVSGYRWSSAFSFAIIYSFFLIDAANALQMPPSTIAAFETLFAVVLTGMAIFAIIRAKAFVAPILHGNAVDEEHPSFIQAIRLKLADHWHKLAILFLATNLVIVLIGVENSFALMLRGTVLTIAVLIAARFGFVAIYKWKTPDDGSPLIHRQVLSFILKTALWTLTAAAIAATWGVSITGFVATPIGQKIVGAGGSIAIMLGVLAVVFEMIHGSIERHLRRKDSITREPIASARAQTMLPMLRTTTFVIFCAIAVITSLSSLGINIAPLLAGAGVLGVALGFGSQSLVKDFLTGLFIVAENAVAVGDVVKIDDCRGVVETLSVRTIRLRDQEGALHILPFSEVTKITNMTRGFAYAVVNIGVSYSCDLERVMQVLREVGASIQEDPVFKRVVLEPIEVLGVEMFEASSITIRARIRTRPGKQWDVRRLLLLRIKQRFDAEGIEIPFPIVTHINKTTA